VAVPLATDAPVAIVAALIAHVWTVVSRDRIVVLDPSATGHTAGAMGRSGRGRLLDLVDRERNTMSGAEIDGHIHVDDDGRVGLTALELDDPSLADFEVSRALSFLNRRYRTVVTVIDPTVADDLMRSALSGLPRVVAVTPERDTPSWLLSGGGPLSQARDAGRLTVATLGEANYDDSSSPFHVVGLGLAFRQLRLRPESWTLSPRVDVNRLSAGAAVSVLRLGSAVFAEREVS